MSKVKMKQKYKQDEVQEYKIDISGIILADSEEDALSKAEMLMENVVEFSVDVATEFIK